MGTTLARQIEMAGMAGLLSGLSPAAISCAHIIALNAHDTGTKTIPARIYFRGWEHLARAALGRATYDDAAERAVARALTELIDAGLIKPIGRRSGRRTGLAMYEVIPPI